MARRTALALLLWSGSAGVTVRDSPPDESPEAARSPAHGLRTREVRHYDFEEVEREPAAFPFDFYRIGLPDAMAPATTFDGAPSGPRNGRPGHPAFGSMGYARDASHSGSWSFKFELGGGSMTAALDPRAVPVIPGGDYLVTAWVRTSGLVHAQARLSAMFVNQRREPIALSRIESSPFTTDGEWRAVAVRVPGEFADAFALVADLEVLQPAQCATASSSSGSPRLEDVSGSVWFDDVTIWHVPRLDLGTTALPGHGNIITAPIEPGLEVAVTDFASESLPAHLTVCDLSGRVVYSELLPPTVGRSRRRIDLSCLPFGWYRAIVDIRQDGVDLGGAHIDFAYLPEGDALPTFGLSLEHEALAEAAESATLAARLGCSPIVLPAWDTSHHRDATRSEFEPIRAAADRLQDLGAELTFALPLVPDELALELGLERADALSMFEGASASTESSMETMLFALGQRVSRWQIGPIGSVEAPWRDDVATAASAAARTLSRLVPGPLVVLPWSVEHQPLADIGCAYHLLIPCNVAPASIAAAIAPWLQFDGAWFTIEPLPEGQYSHLERTHDLALRMLHAWRAGATRLLLTRPWTRDRGAESMPDPLLAAWLQIGRTLRGRSFAGEVPVGKGLECWLLEGPGGAGMVAWNESAHPAEAAMEAPSSNTPLAVRDIFGNVLPHADNNGPSITLRPDPLFIEGVDAAVVRLRQGFRVEPGFAPSTRLEHAHELVIANPWPITISGSLRLTEPASWSFTPSRLDFTIPSGGEARLPLLIAFGAHEVAGPKRIEAEVHMHTGATADFHVAADFDIRNEKLSLDPVWRIVPRGSAPGDLMIDAYVTNTGDEPVHLEAFVRAPGYPRMSRLLARLDPGETTVRSFLLEGGEARLSGQRLLIGIAEVDGPSRINREIGIP